MEIASKTQVIECLSKILKPITKNLFSDLNEKSYNNIIMNIIANISNITISKFSLFLKL